MSIYFDTVRLSGLTDIELPIYGIKPSDPYQVTSIAGLGPPELEVLIAENHAPGGIYINRRAQGREPVIRIGLNPDYKTGQTVADLRYALYGLLSPGVDPRDQSVKLYLVQNNVPRVLTTGYIKRIEIVPFNKNPEVQLTMTCLSPYLEEPEFTILTDLIPASNAWTINNAGLAPTGVAFEIEILTPISIFSISIDNSTKMDFVADFQIGDKLIVNTNEAQRFVGLDRGGNYVSYLGILTADSDWLTLHGGVHTLRTSPISEFTWRKFEYKAQYWGI